MAQQPELNPASHKEQAEGSGETAKDSGQAESGGITNRPLSDEEDAQAKVPPRGDRKDGGSHA